MATYASKLRKTAVDGQTIRLLPDGRIRGNAGMEPFSAGTLGGAPSVFYVDGNVVSSGNGLGWLSAFKTVAEGILAAHTYMGTSGNRAWAHRATVYVCGDDPTEDLTLMAEKSDIIGVGTANSRHGPRIYGNHVIQASATDNYNGCAWYNITFTPTAAGILFDLPTGHHGIEWHRCWFEWAAASVTGIRMTACNDSWINECQFVKGSSTGFSTAAILFGNGSTINNRITNNFIDANLGIVVPTGVTGSEGNRIDNNVIVAVGLTIDDNDDSFYVTNNRLISEAALGASAYDFNIRKAAGNIVSGSADSAHVPEINA